MAFFSRLFFAAGLVLSTLVLPASAASLSDTDKSEVEKIVRDYILENPGIIRDALIALERERELQEANQRRDALAANKDAIFNSQYQVVLGNPQGDVTLVEFFDYNCHYCRRALGDLHRLMDEDKNLRVVLKEFPVLGEGSLEAARVAIAVNSMAPEKYLEFHNKMLESEVQANLSSAVAVAAEMGLDIPTLQSSLDNDDVRATLQEVYNIANTLGINGTPSYVVGDEVVVGARGYDYLKERIASYRECGSTQCQ
ncbi:DsbA family protein [Coralliovum pocilloporae]|uniref:DsbA family protein n=1 Tax=Coralliovum pocilloporae TaxID=3066369 RepID=UPI0033075264